MVVTRVKAVDALRGFSLFGILMANLLIFQYGMYGKDMLENLSSLDTVSYYSLKVIIEGSFMPIFTILFGFSLIKMIESIRAKGKKSRWAIIRRGIGLLTLGFLHSFFIWEGDILLFYGMMIFCLLIFINRKPKTLIIWASILFIITCALMYGGDMLTPGEKAEIKAYNIEQTKVYSEGSYGEIIDFRLNAEIPGMKDDGLYILIMLFVSPLLYAPLFLTGMAFAKWQLFENVQAKLKVYRLALVLIPLAITLKVIGQFDHVLKDITVIAGQQILALGYVFLFMWIFTIKPTSKVMLAFESVGKLSLTNYLMQSVICTFVFYGYGLGLYGQMGVTLGIAFGLVVYILQCYVSTAYLKRFHRGPVEILLRIWTNFSWNGKVKKKKIIGSQEEFV
ncbi:DUF418 domain-containing protein [Lysinibacillus sp. KU-BSD001]|uniref:DUF418 domain-containing protein n=1 Tax=Lysinibacillus sp. KU-BSD001 TaxID=3141328 RepID=UPI0036E8DA6B